MIGKVTLPNKNIIVLEDDGKISSTDKQLEKFIEILLQNYRRKYSPAQGSFGVTFLQTLAKNFKGKVFIEDKPSLPPGTIY